MEIKFVLEPEEFAFLRKEAEKKSEMVSDLVRQIVLKHIDSMRSAEHKMNQGSLVTNGENV